MRDFDREALRAELAAVAPELAPLAWDVLGAVHRIDAVALDPGGGVHVVFFCDAPDDGAVLTRALAAIAWLEPRLPDWEQLARASGLDAARPVRAVLVARAFEPDTLAAARWLGDARVRCLPARPGPAAADEASSGAQAADTPPAPHPADGVKPHALAPHAPATAAARSDRARAEGPRPPPAAAAGPASPPEASRFRTRLTEADLGAASSPLPASS